jgi:hypothetical protein
MDTYEALKDRIGRLRAQVEAFMSRVKDNEVASLDLSTVITNAVRTEEMLSALILMPKDMQRLSLDYEMGSSLATATNTMHGYLVAQQYGFSNLSPEDITFLPPFLDEMKGICGQIPTLYDDATRASADIAQLIDPAAFFTTYTPFFDYVADKAQLIQHDPPMTTDRCVMYHPQLTLYLLANMLGFLARTYWRQHQARGTVIMSFHEDANFAYLHLTAPVLMTPILWGDLLRSSRHYDYEYLREIGGDIEPLTWDEGYGQGVIVRLPWAKDL